MIDILVGILACGSVSMGLSSLVGAMVNAGYSAEVGLGTSVWLVFLFTSGTLYLARDAQPHRTASAHAWMARYKSSHSCADADTRLAADAALMQALCDVFGDEAAWALVTDPAFDHAAIRDTVGAHECTFPAP